MDILMDFRFIQTVGNRLENEFHKICAVRGGVGLIECLIIFLLTIANHIFNRDIGKDRIEVLQHQRLPEASKPTIAVNKRMDGHKPLMKASCVFDRMVLFLPSRNLLHEFLHESWNFFGVRKLVGSPRHEDAAFSVDTGLFFLNLAEEQFVQGEDIQFGESRAALERVYVVKGGGMADGFEVIT